MGKNKDGRRSNKKNSRIHLINMEDILLLDLYGYQRHRPEYKENVGK